MREEMLAGPIYVALILAAVSTLLSVTVRNGNFYTETHRLSLARITANADALAGAMAENPSAMIPP